VIDGKANFRLPATAPQAGVVVLPFQGAPFGRGEVPAVLGDAGFAAVSAGGPYCRCVVRVGAKPALTSFSGTDAARLAGAAAGAGRYFPATRTEAIVAAFLRAADGVLVVVGQAREAALVARFGRCMAARTEASRLSPLLPLILQRVAGGAFSSPRDVAGPPARAATRPDPVSPLLNSDGVALGAELSPRSIPFALASGAGSVCSPRVPDADALGGLSDDALGALSLAGNGRGRAADAQAASLAGFVLSTAGFTAGRLVGSHGSRSSRERGWGQDRPLATTGGRSVLCIPTAA
jgi:hypothetical protein